jgi:acetoin utilization deacetylase AcuC-like enzyme
MDEMIYYYPAGHAAHVESGHPERPERIEAVRQGLETAGLWEPFRKLSPLLLPEKILSAVHTPVYLEMLEAACVFGERLDPDTFTTPASSSLANATAGGALAVAQAVWQGQARRGFALTRPPGHHATPSRGMGFCLLNNISLAAEYLIQEHGAQRLAILDLDLHHGNGTQEIFWLRPDVFYLSTHQMPLYPGTGWLDEVGSGPGEGFTANFPLPPGSGDEAFSTVLDELVLPLLSRFAPEMLLISVGFDPHWREPLGHLQLSAGVYGQMIASLAGWADSACEGKIALVLEGGYDLDASAACGQAIVSALLGRAIADPLGPSPRPEGNSWHINLRRAHEIWGL